MKSSTHSGTCQACGRLQAVHVNTGLLAKHGYTVEYGYFSGTCSGADHLPLEQDKSFAEQTVVGLRAWAEKRDAEAAGEITKVVVKVKDEERSMKFRTVWKQVLMTRDEFFAHFEPKFHYHPAEARARFVERDWQDEVSLARRQLAAAAKGAREAADHLEALIATVHGKPLQVREQDVLNRRAFMPGNYEAGRALVEELKAQGIQPRVRGGYRRVPEMTITWRTK